MRPSRVIRVGVSTNYGFTPAEQEELESTIRAQDRPFVNANGETRIVNQGMPVIVTLNPYLDRFKPPTGDLEAIKVCRVKWIPGAKPVVRRAYDRAVRWARRRGLPLLVTRMRFFNKAALRQYCSDPTLYHWYGGQYRPVMRPETGPGVYLCDGGDGGCPACRLCSVLTYGCTTVPHGLNLVASLPPEGSPLAHCDKGCPQCWAKRVLERAGTGGRPKCGVVYRNSKQNGRLHEGA